MAIKYTNRKGETYFKRSKKYHEALTEEQEEEVREMLRKNFSKFENESIIELGVYSDVDEGCSERDIQFTRLEEFIDFAVNEFNEYDLEGYDWGEGIREFPSECRIGFFGPNFSILGRQSYTYMKQISRFRFTDGHFGNIGTELSIA